MSINCLMLKMDERLFFTHPHNFPQIVEFARTCKAEISVVKTSNVKMLELPELAKSICNHATQLDSPQYEVIEIKSLEQKPRRPRKKLLLQAGIIHNHIRAKLIQNETVSLSGLENEFQDFGLSKAALCNHIRRVKTELVEEGYAIENPKKGQCRIVKDPQK